MCLSTHDCFFPFFFITGGDQRREFLRNAAMEQQVSWRWQLSWFDDCCWLTTRVDPMDGWTQGFVELCAGHSALTSVSRLIFLNGFASLTNVQSRPKTQCFSYKFRSVFAKLYTRKAHTFRGVPETDCIFKAFAENWSVLRCFSKTELAQNLTKYA